MTSFTRKLHSLDPHAAQQVREMAYRDYRYGKHVTLAEFAASTHLDPVFGRRQTVPALPAYECWAPAFGKPKQIVRASDSFQARQQYAAHHQIAVVEVAARRK